MAHLRHQALQSIRQNAAPFAMPVPFKSSERFAENVFNKKAMREFLSPEIYEALNEAIDQGHGISSEIARQVA
ncbi:MAG: glutamine synthetase III, partial [Sphingomonadales bacterium]|nr:glutamine synthetase III [Sphingomonadales bacterium]